jgi:acyl carrier protein
MSIQHKTEPLKTMSLEFRQKINGIFSRHFLIPTHHIKGFRYLEDLGMTHLEKLELLNYMEDAFHIEISESDGQRIRTVRDAISTLDKYLHIKNEQRKAS